MSEKITFKELVEKISKNTQLSEQRTDSFIHELVGIIESGLEKGEKITISGFGKFELRFMEERKGRNPQTGDEITIPAQNKVVFKPYKALREHVNLPFKNLQPQILDSPDKQEKESDHTAPVAAALSTVSATQSKKTKDDPAEAEESIEDLVRERPSPVKGKIPNQSVPPKPVPEKVLIEQSSDQKKEQPKKLPPPAASPKEPDRAVQESGRFHWSYAAASILILLAVFLILFLIFSRQETTTQTEPEIAGQTPLEQIEQPAPLSPAPSAVADEPETPAVEEESAEAEPAADHREYSIQAGESLWSIAEQTYGDPYLWPLIYGENRDQLSNPNQISSGNSLLIPEIGDPENLSENEAVSVARGYLSVYDWVRANQPESARYYLWAAGSYSPEELERVSDRVDQQDLTFATQR
ncbi:HU family DNA-binding protein [Rhodohalobacter sp. SW132]|uniref:HU family DNA-binding protein n=1 Tax=Rhodohalobacter sp. SW132 TaxID=2293433 RepID=UPI000E25E9B1|nr:HU family DNA-binding protein [Rhodohalobacter sp. SW132]REL37623.1 HU family DNA-binding protein [Rhodohalobacter sp. SW132]